MSEKRKDFLRLVAIALTVMGSAFALIVLLGEVLNSQWAVASIAIALLGGIILFLKNRN